MKFFQKIISVLMLVALCSTIIPYNLFHHHHSRYQVADSKICGLDTCYNSIYKPFDRSVEHCNHKNHVSEELDDCLFCSLKFVHLADYILPQQYAAFVDSKCNYIHSKVNSFPEFLICSQVGNRGPPSNSVS